MKKIQGRVELGSLSTPVQRSPDWAVKQILKIYQIACLISKWIVNVMVSLLSIFFSSPTPHTPLSIQPHTLKKTHKKLKC
jgi:hypothetical protein